MRSEDTEDKDVDDAVSVLLDEDVDAEEERVVKT